MCLSGSVDSQIANVLALPHSGVSGRDERGKVCTRAARCQKTARTFRHSHPCAKPFEHCHLDLVWSSRDRPDAREKVVAGGEPITKQSRKSRAARNVCEKSRVNFSRVIRED